MLVSAKNTIFVFSTKNTKMLLSCIPLLPSILLLDFSNGQYNAVGGVLALVVSNMHWEFL